MNRVERQENRGESPGQLGHKQFLALRGKLRAAESRLRDLERRLDPKEPDPNDRLSVAYWERHDLLTAIVERIARLASRAVKRNLEHPWDDEETLTSGLALVEHVAGEFVNRLHAAASRGDDEGTLERALASITLQQEHADMLRSAASSDDEGEALEQALAVIETAEPNHLGMLRFAAGRVHSWRCVLKETRERHSSALEVVRRFAAMTASLASAGIRVSSERLRGERTAIKEGAEA
jgi:hypothetical protein